MDIPNQLGSSEIWKGAPANQAIETLCSIQKVAPVQLFSLDYGSIKRLKNKVSLTVDANQSSETQLEKFYAFLKKL